MKNSQNPNRAGDLPDFLWIEDEDGPPPRIRPSRDAGESSGHIPGEAGLWIFILGDMTLFGVILLVFLNDRRADRSGFRSAAAQLIQPIGAVNTLVLLLGSYLVVLAAFAHRRDRSGMARRLIAGAIGCAIAFGCLKLFEYSAEISAGNTPTVSVFFTFYFVLTGLHLLHVAIGTALLSKWLLVLRQTRPWAPSSRLLEGIASYWHMVDLLWIAIFAIVYLVSAE